MAEALIVVDLQNDFCPGGALPVADGHAIVPLVNRLLARATICILTQDWHPADHHSFAASRADGVDPPLWPVHCVQGTHGAMFHPALHADRADLVLRKGFRREVDSYSAFFENDRVTPSGLDGYLRSRGATSVVLVGLALDYCVAASALDAVRLGYATRVVLAACRAIDHAGSRAAAEAAMQAAGMVLDTRDAVV